MKNPDKNKFSDTHRRLKHDDVTVAMNTVHMAGRMSLQELIDHMAAVAPGVSLDEFGINFGSLTWECPSTLFERMERQKADIDREQRKERWERESLERLLDKYGIPDQEEEAV